MRHFVQYHNAAVRGPYRHSPRNGFGITTDKTVSSLLGDRIWLVTRCGNPPRYCLCETFIAEEFDRASYGPQRNQATSRLGNSFSPLLAIDSAPWFPALFRVTGNFAFGLQHIKERRIVRGLQAALVENDKITQELRMEPLRRHPVGGGFGDLVENKLVERAAVRAVMAHYKSRRWRVESREMQQLGYDLLCKHGSIVHHVEVKGIRGSVCAFILTANEKAISEIDRAFRLIVVKNALDPKKRKLVSFTGPELSNQFDLSAISFIAKPRK
jgi:hypothetical protein